MGNGGAKREQKRGTENEEESDEVPRGVQWEDGRVSSLAFVLYGLVYVLYAVSFHPASQLLAPPP